MKLNKAEKFVEAQSKLGKTFEGIRSAIFEKLGTWNFPPEYKDALIGYDPLNDCLDGIGRSAGAEEAVFGRMATNHVVCPFCDKENCTCEDILDLPLPDRECFICPKDKCKCKVIHLDPLPHPGTQKWEGMIDFMRADLETNMAYSKIIDMGIRLVEERGGNFREEFEKWKKEKKEHV
jgi:hypothetical protein